MMLPLHPAIIALADAAKSRHPRAEAIVAYGSALRDASPDSTLIDLYVLTTDLAGVSTSYFARLGCWIAAPNVYYLEATHDGKTYRCKYAVLPLLMFQSKCSANTGNPYFWARFCQPVHIVWVKDDAAGVTLNTSLAMATATAYAHAKSIAPAANARDAWAALFAETYRTELRPEGKNRAQDIVDQNLSHYEAASIRHAKVPTITPVWSWLRLQGKILTILRLAKASFTFQGGPDYLAWKIKRHSGVDIQLTDFQRRHPLLASITLLPMLLRKGAVK